MIINNLVTKVFQLFLLISPIAISADVNMDIFDLIFFRTSMIILFAASLMDTPKRLMPYWVNRIVFLLLGLCVFNLFIHGFAPQILANTMNLFLAVMGLYTAYTYIDEKANIKRIMLIAGAINLTFFIGQKLKFDPVWEEISKDLPGAFFGNNPRLANYFALLIPFLPMYLLPLSIGLFFLTKQLVILIPLLIIVYLKLKTLFSKIGFGVILFLCSILMWTHIKQSMGVRLEVWIPALRAFFDRPFIGFGIGTKIIPNLDALFSSYLSFIVGAGVMGLAWFIYAFKSIRKQIIKSPEATALITLSIMMLLEYPIELTRNWHLIMAIILMAILRFNKTPCVK